MLPGFLSSARTVACSLLVVTAGGAAIGATWYETGQSIARQERDAARRAGSIVTGLTATYADQINRQILALDQALDQAAQEWEADPNRFDLQAWLGHVRILKGISRDLFLTDENGIIRRSTVPEILGKDAAVTTVFEDAKASGNAGLWLGRASAGPILTQWHIDAARGLHHSDGSFAGIVDAGYRLSALNDVFAASGPPGAGYAAVIGVKDGRTRAAFGTSGVTPDQDILTSPMFTAISGADAGFWTGPSPSDADVRIHAFRRIPGRDLVVVTGVDQREALLPATVWQRQSDIFASVITGLVAATALLLLGFLNSRGSRAQGTTSTTSRRSVDTQALVVVANARADAARAHSDMISRRLQATFDAVTDGVAIFDARLALVEWNNLFPERSGVDASIVRVGMPMDAVLREQAEKGYFGGGSADVEADVERRAALLRAGNFGASQTFQLAGRMLELRCHPLEDGGFVAIYSDVTETRQTRQALRDARDALLRERYSKIRFLGVIAHELRGRVGVLMRAVSGRGDALSGQSPLLADRIRRVGGDLSELAVNAVEVPQMEAGTLEARAALVAVRPLFQYAVDTIQPAARDVGITAYLIMRETAPDELVTDPERMRQVVKSLLSEALRFAVPDSIWLLVDGGDHAKGESFGLRLTIRCLGPPIPEARRAAMFPPLDAVSVPTEADAVGTRLGAAVARYLAMLLGGTLRCQSWTAADSRTGNDFILTLPNETLLPRHGVVEPGRGFRPLPRTRILIAGIPTGLKMAAVTMMRRDGHMVHFAMTGDEAVQSLRRLPYDIVFMDTVLHDMTIDAAMNLIRQMDGPGRTVPVIAVAARHDGGEERSWRDAGVDDILTNPSSLQEFTEAISRNVWFSRSLASSVTGSPDTQDQTEDGIPILSSQRIQELRANIPSEHLLDMVEECLADLFRRLPTLRRALIAGVPGPVAAQAHAMVGMAGGYGMAVLEARLRAVLAAARARRLDTIEGAAAMIEADLNRTAAVMRRTLRPARTDLPI